jgi:NAD-dependent dihydropyrimidine dehydrogenase PreA subunit/flavodoxin
MICYFTGTGNSLWAAKQLNQAFGGKMLSIADELNLPDNRFDYFLADDEPLFFVFPVHSWGPPALLAPFIEKIQLKNHTNQPIYLVCTCGDNCGDTDKILAGLLAKKSLKPTKSYSIQMPNTYILMKGFGIDSKELEKEKLEKSPGLINGIIENIKTQHPAQIYERGKRTFLKSRLVYPLFIKYAIGKSKFYADAKCTACRLCEKICPTKNISIKAGKPVWKDACIQCAACIHRCPTQAIEYGRITQTQGRYHHPEV